MKNILLQLPFYFSLITSTIGSAIILTIIKPYCGGVPSYLLSALGFMLIHYVINGVIFNGWLLKTVIENNTPIFTYDSQHGYIGFPDEPPKEIPWESVEKIEIITTDEGPWQEDLWWVFFILDTDEPLLIPNGAKGIDAIFNILEDKFKNIDMEATAKAMCSCTNARFYLWKSDNGN